MIDRKEGNLDLELFLSSHSEDELVLFRNLLDKLIDNKRKEKEKGILIPVSIFSDKLAPGEAVIKYLKENKTLRFCEIASELNKKENSIWLNYKRAVKKKRSKFLITSEKYLLPIYIFKSDLSYLEAITFYLRDSLRLSNNEISSLLNKSPQTLSISYKRAKLKLQNG